MTGIKRSCDGCQRATKAIDLDAFPLVKNVDVIDKKKRL